MDQQKPQYWTTWRHHGSRTTWEPTTARTLRGAKRVATQRYSGQLLGATLHVGQTLREDERGRPDIWTVAIAPNNGSGDWHDNPEFR